jgi:hypothetical protein
MNPQNESELRDLLKKSVPSAARAELTRDLWPQMLEKLNDQPVHIPWFDWALAGLAAAALIFFPGVIPALFYQL